MENPILISWINDFMFCPVSIYFHMLYGNTEPVMYQSKAQIDGKAVHEAVDSGRYSSKKDILCGIDVYCERYGLQGKIDIYDACSKELTERKNRVSSIYDGQIFQLYAQYFAMEEMGHEIRKLTIRSVKDNRVYNIRLPKDDPDMFTKFEKTLEEMHYFDISAYIQDNPRKCNTCIYEPACDRSGLC